MLRLLLKVQLCQLPWHAAMVSWGMHTVLRLGHVPADVQSFVFGITTSLIAGACRKTTKL